MEQQGTENSFTPSNPENTTPNEPSPPTSTSPESGAETTPPSGGDRRALYRALFIFGLVSAIVVTAIISVVIFSGKKPLTLVKMHGTYTFFDDKVIRKELERKNIRVQAEAKGSREVANNPNPESFHIASLGSAEQADHLRGILDKAGVKDIRTSDPRKFTLFSTPVIVTSEPIAQLLATKKIANQIPVDHPAPAEQNKEKNKEQKQRMMWTFDVRAFIEATNRGTPEQGKTLDLRWSHFGPNDTVVKNNTNKVMVTMTDLARSNSAALFAALASSAANNGDVVTSKEDVDRVLPQFIRCFKDQGSPVDTTRKLSAALGQNGVQTYPLTFLYENDFIAAMREYHQRAAEEHWVAMYPDRKVGSKNTLVSWSKEGDLLLDALENSTIIKDRIRTHYGYRDGSLDFPSTMEKEGFLVPARLDEFKSPSWPIMEHLISGVKS